MCYLQHIWPGLPDPPALQAGVQVRALLITRGSRVLQGSIDLIARLLSMVEINRLQYSFTGRKHVPWMANAMKD
jgi:hypothetical protein